MRSGIPTESIGSIPRTRELLHAMASRGSADPSLEPQYERAVRDTIEALEETGSPIITDGEQRKFPSFWTCNVEGMPNLAPDGVVVGQRNGRLRQLPRLTKGPFRFLRRADQYLDMALRYARRPVKQAVISAAALSLLYPVAGVPGYPRAQFIEDLLREHETEVRACLLKGAHSVQIDVPALRYALHVDPSGGMLREFTELNNQAVSRLTGSERAPVGVHTCLGHWNGPEAGPDVDYAVLLSSLFELRVSNFYIALAGEPDRARVLQLIRQHLRPHQRAYVGVISMDSRVETAEEVCDRVLEAAQYIPASQLGTTDDCGFAPFSDDDSISREVAFQKIRARVLGTALASQILEDR